MSLFVAILPPRPYPVAKVGRMPQQCGPHRPTKWWIRRNQSHYE